MQELNVFYHVKMARWAFELLLTTLSFVVVSRAVRSKVKQSQSMEMGLLKTSERDQESEDEI